MSTTNRLVLGTTLQIAARALARNKLRATLTMLGITIGIAAVICTVAIGQGGTQMVQDQLVGLGTNLVWVEAGGANLNGVRTGNGETKTLSVDDALAIARSVSTIAYISPNVDGPVQVVYGHNNWGTNFRGVSPEYLDIRQWYPVQGMSFTQDDLARAANVCMLGKTVADTLFGNEDPLGKIIRVQNIPFQVLGVMQPKGLATTGRDQGDFVIVPYTTGMKKIKGNNWLDDIFLSANSSADIPHAEEQITQLLRQRHKLRSEEPDDFNIRHPEDTLRAQVETSRTFTLMLASVASVSLLVGGIGIMNIMLVSVTERTREVGIRMAVGATEEDVRMQFLIEALALSLLGGFAGMVIGILASTEISQLLQWPTVVSPIAVLVAVFVSVAVGILFGYYPAHKASRLDPIEALRYE